MIPAAGCCGGRPKAELERPPLLQGFCVLLLHAGPDPGSSPLRPPPQPHG
eukprot:COSAG01_NODE_52501_length_346_cov_0.838057_1_plen_49_part_01